MNRVPANSVLAHLGADRDISWPELELLARIFKRVELSETNECWLWKGASDKGGYGLVVLPHSSGEKKTTRRPHRLVWTLLRGDLGDLTLDHLCCQKMCVNPNHLEPCSLEENARRGWERNPDRPHANAAKTHCPHGHPYDEQNTYMDGKGARKCRECIRLRQANRREHNRDWINELKRRSYHRNKKKV